MGRASKVLSHLEEANRRENKEIIGKTLENISNGTGGGMQMTFFQLDDPVLSQIRNEIASTDINNLTPMAALNKLHDIKKIITGKD